MKKNEFKKELKNGMSVITACQQTQCFEVAAYHSCLIASLTLFHYRYSKPPLVATTSPETKLSLVLSAALAKLGLLHVPASPIPALIRHPEEKTALTRKHAISQLERKQQEKSVPSSDRLS